MAKINEIVPLLQPLGFEKMDGVCTGVWRGYAVSFMTGPNGQLQSEFAVRLDRKNSTPAKAAAMALKEAGLKVSAVNKGSAMAFFPRFNRKSPLDQQLVTFLDTAAAALNANDIPPAATCVVCGGGAPESLCWVNGWQPVHAGCIHQRTVHTRETAEENRQNGSYLLGLLGAVIGAAAGTIPNVLTIILMERVFAALFALIPLASMWGYRKLGGKRNGVSIIIVIVLSLISVLLITLLVATWDTAQEFRAPFFEVFGAIAAYAFTAEGFPLLLQDSAVSLIFIALGILIAWRFLNQTDESVVKLAEASENTIRSNPAYMAAGGAPVYAPGEHKDP